MSISFDFPCVDRLVTFATRGLHNAVGWPVAGGTSKSEHEHSIPQVNDNHSNESRHAWFVNDVNDI